MLAVFVWRTEHNQTNAVGMKPKAFPASVASQGPTGAGSWGCFMGKGALTWGSHALNAQKKVEVRKDKQIEEEQWERQKEDSTHQGAEQAKLSLSASSDPQTFVLLTGRKRSETGSCYHSPVWSTTWRPEEGQGLWGRDSHCWTNEGLGWRWAQEKTADQGEGPWDTHPSACVLGDLPQCLLFSGHTKARCEQGTEPLETRVVNLA